MTALRNNSAIGPASRRGAAAAVRRPAGALPLLENALRLFMWAAVALFSLLFVVVMLLG